MDPFNAKSYEGQRSDLVHIFDAKNEKTLFEITKIIAHKPLKWGEREKYCFVFGA